jgi:hypothetical protein
MIPEDEARGKHRERSGDARDKSGGSFSLHRNGRNKVDGAIC